MKTEFLCDECFKPLTKKEASVYSLQWQSSGDMYCKKHETRGQFEGTRIRSERDRTKGVPERIRDGVAWCWDVAKVLLWFLSCLIVMGIIGYIARSCSGAGG